MPRLSQSKVMSPKKLEALCRRWRTARKKIVFTNGCFDLIHRGHVQYLERARKLGHILVVALNTDESVRVLNKGPNRPVNPLADRLQVMAALECVDAVTWFDAPTPVPLILTLKPHLIVKGGDWKASQIAGRQEARAWGGKTRSLPYLKGRSTTSILERAGHPAKPSKE